MADKTEKRRIYLYINGKEVEDNLKSLTSTSRQLKNEIAKLTPGTDEFIKKSKELQQVNGRIADIRKEVNGLGGVFGSLKQAVSSNLFTMVSWGAAIGAAGSIIRGAYKTISDFDESVANLAKTTGLSKEAASDLAKEVIKIDTRTPVTQLIELASAAGRLGLKGQDIVDFTEQSDRAFVALGDSLEGSAEEIGLTLGKIGSNFDLEKKYGVGEAINKIGSALNELGANSKATEGPIIDFTQRLAGVAAQAGLTNPEVMALGALFDESGQSIEVASTTFNTLLPAMGKDVERFAKVAGMNVDEFSTLIKDKPFEALKAVAIGAKSSEKGLVGLSETLANYGVDSARAASIVGVLSENTDRLTELQAIANKGFEEGTSLMNEFAIKNDTVNAQTEKLSKNYDAMIISLQDGEGVFSRLGKQILETLNHAVNFITALNSKDAWKSIKDNAYAFGEEIGLLSTKQKEAAINMNASSEIVDKLTKLHEAGTIKTEDYNKAISKLASGWKYVKEEEKGAIEVSEEGSSQRKKTIEEIEAEEKAAEKLAEEKIKANKKAVEEEVKAKEKLAESIAKLREDAKLNAMAEDQAEVERVYLKYEKLLEAELLNEEQRKELQALRNEELDLLDEEQEAKRIAKEEKDLADRQAFLDELDLIEQSNINKELADVDAKYAALYAKADKFGIDTKALQKLHADEISLIIKKQAQDELKVTEETQKARRASIDATINAFGSMFDSLGVIFAENESLQKTFALGQIAVDTAKAISSLTAMSEANPGNVITFGAAGIAQYGAGILRILASMARAKNLLGFDEGGFTGPGFGNPDSSGYKVAGYVHENEWVAPEWMTQSPQFADTIRGLEYARRTKSGYADGGFTPTSTNSAPNFDNSSNTALLESINMLNTILANGIKANAVIDQSGLLNIQDGLDELTQKQQLFK